jgi:hypothetical protein
MIRTAIFLAAALVAGAAHADQQCALHQLGSLEIKNRGGIPTVPVMINGKPQMMAIEPSNPDSFLTVKFGKTEDLGISSGSERKGGGHLFISRNLHYIVPEFVIGSTRATNLPFLRRENAPESFGDGIVGGLGADIFSRFDVEIDIKNGKIVLFSGDHCPGKVVYWTKSAYAAVRLDMDLLSHSSVQMKLDGKAVSVALTLSETHAYMSMKAAKRIFDLDENSQGVTRVSDTSANTVRYHFPFKTLSVNGVTISNPKIDIDPGLLDCRPRRCYGGSDVYLGTEELKYLHLFFAYSEGMLYVTPADAH